MSYYGGNQNGGQPGAQQQQQMGRQPANPGLPPNVQQVLPPQLFNINVNPNQLHNFFNEHNQSQNTLQLNAAAANASSILLQQQTQTFPVNLINDQLGVGVGQLLSSAQVPQSQMQGLPISMSSALNFPQTLQVHTQAPASEPTQSQSQQSKQKVFTGTVTKTHDNFGFIDEEVFFQMGVVKGPILPKEGDRVLVEADFNASMPFKWNATRVQIVNIGGGLNSSLNNMSNINASQSQHMGFNSNVGMQKQPPGPPSQSNPTRMHGPQPVSIVSNPHSVYSGGNNPRIRPPNVGPGPGIPPPVPPTLTPQQREPPKRTMGMHVAPDPPPYTSNSSSMSSLMPSSDRDHRDIDRDRCRERDRSRERIRERSRSRDRMRPRSRDRSRERIRERSRERRENLPRVRSRSPRDRVHVREMSLDGKVGGMSRERQIDNNRGDRTTRVRDRSPDRSHPLPRGRSRSQERSREKDIRSRDKPKSDRDHPSTEKPKERDRSKEQRDKESVTKNGRDHSLQKSSSSTTTSRSNKEESSSSINKIKDDKKSSEKSKSDKISSDRAKRSRSRESVRTDKGHSSITDRSRSRSGSPKRSKTLRPPPRYAVELPKFALDTKDVSVKELQRRYPNLYIPSDFFLAKSTWMDTFPLHSPFEVGHPCPVHIMRKGVHRIEVVDTQALENKFKDVPDILEPADASFTFKAKVMIPSISSLEAIYRKSCGINEDGIETPSAETNQHIDRLISFIVGMKTNKHEVMALGGPWSPSLDGQNPQSDRQTLINTAIRCVRALAGINLSKCKHWYRFMELYYKRSNCLETVVYFLPDVWSCLPGSKEWSSLKSMYKYALCGDKSDSTLKANGAPGSATNEEKLKLNSDAAIDQPGTRKGTEGVTNSSQCIPEAPQLNDTVVAADKTSNSCPEDNSSSEQRDDSTPADEEDQVLNDSGLLVIDEACDDGGEEHSEGPDLDLVAGNNAGDNGVISLEEHSSGKTANSNCDDASSVVPRIDNCDVVTDRELEGHQGPGSSQDSPAVNPKALNVAQLREELGRRNLCAKGLKAVLVSRLTKAIKDEETLNPVSSDQVQEVSKREEETPNATDSEVNKLSEAPDTEMAIKPEEEEQVNEEEKKVSDENCIRLVNPDSIFESQDDEGSIDDLEMKEDPESESLLSSLNTTEEFEFVSKFPPDTFPVIKPGMKEEEIKMWERRYALPKNPRLIIYPSATAKGGNFDCISMTLGVLRDYRIIDKKEDNFEVSLFSEFFHEMLQRDFAFRIYKEIVIEARKEESQQQDSGKEKDGEVAEPNNKKRKLSNSSSGSTVIQGKKITDPYLLLSFIFFDVTRCGYITESDLEDLCGCIGMGLTRSQIRKVVQKVVQKGNLYYRKWTDRPETSKTILSMEESKALAQGNNIYFPVFVLQDRKDAILSKQDFSNESEEAGAIIAQVDDKTVDVRKLMLQLEEKERELAVSESGVNVMKNSLDESKSQVSELKKSNESLKEELSKIKEALKKAESAEKSAKEHLDVFKRASERYCERIKDLMKFPSNSSSPKDKEKEEVAPQIKDNSKSE